MPTKFGSEHRNSFPAVFVTLSISTFFKIPLGSIILQTVNTMLFKYSIEYLPLNNKEIYIYTHTRLDHYSARAVCQWKLKESDLYRKHENMTPGSVRRIILSADSRKLSSVSLF